MSTVITHRPSPSQVAGRAALSVSLAVSGVAHAYLYVHGYRYIPTVGAAFLIQSSAFVALAILILFGGRRWLYWAAGLGALGSLIGFAMSRTIGLLGFVEHGWEPPYGPLVVVAEVLTVLIVAVPLITQRKQTAPQG
jgi:drug/metabolite transporter (DMT)-like permease